MSVAAVVESTNSGSSAAQPLKIYFCASIRGEEVSKPFLNKLISHLKEKHGRVLTEHIGYDQCEHADMTNRGIYERDVAWLRESDIVIAECSAASLGVGMELVYAEYEKKPILVLYRWPRPDNKHISGMVSGTTYPNQICEYYKDEFEAYTIMDNWIAEWKKKQNKHPSLQSHINSAPIIDSPLTQLFPGLRYPLIASPMAYRSGAALTLAVAEAGGLGMLGVGYGRDLPWIKDQLNIITSVVSISEKPLYWGSGFITFMLDQPNGTDALDLVLAAKPSAVWFSFGNAEKYAAQSRAAGVKVIISQVQSLTSAIEAAKYSDVLVLQGSEAGGHGTSEATRQELFAQVQGSRQISASIPIVLAGGFGSEESIRDGFAHSNVAGLVLGTRFLACYETLGNADAKRIVIQSSGADTHRGEIFDLLGAPGQWARPYDGRAILYGHSKDWVGRESELHANAKLLQVQNTRYKTVGGLNGGPAQTIFAGTGLDAVTKEESAGEVVRIIGRAMEEGWKRRK